MFRTALPTEAAPGTVRVAGVLVCLPGLAGLAFAVALVIRAAGRTGKDAGSVYAEAGYFAIIAVAVLAVAIGLITGHSWARTPATVVEILLLGVAWYTAGPSGQVIPGVVLAVLCVVTLVLLFNAKARAWAIGEWPPEKADAADSPEKNQPKRNQPKRNQR